MDPDSTPGPNSIPLLKGSEKDFEPTTSATGDRYSPRFEYNFLATVPACSLGQLDPLKPSASSVSDHPLVRGTTSGNHHNSIHKNDIVIAVMGLTGSGKSSFINTAAGKTVVAVGNGLSSQTRAVQPVWCSHPDGHRNVVLVDTPGFDDTHISDVQILCIIAHWLRETYCNNIKLSGLLYLHRISDVRMARTPLRSLSVFRDLCGDNALKNIVLVTTMWDEVEDQSAGSQREEELLSVFWKDMVRLGARPCRFEGTRDSAWEIINYVDLEGPRQRLSLQIQKEMVYDNLLLHETAAAKTLLSRLKDVDKFWKWLRKYGGARQTSAEVSDVVVS